MTPKILILLVEDDALIRLALEEALTEEGFEVVMATSGTEGLATLSCDADRFDALITDIRLGAGPDGWDMARQIRGLLPQMPVVYMSGDSTADWAAQGVPRSVMVPKPFVMAQIITAVSTLLNEAEGR